jgi:putative ABC transport system permease protein
MLGYYLDLARRSFKRNVALTVLMVLAIGFGVGASMTTLTVLRILSADPIPQKSSQLYYVQLEPREARPSGAQKDEPPDQLSRFDAENLLRQAKADHQAMMSGGSAPIEPEKAGLDPFLVDARWTSADFFSLFDVPFVSGTGWTSADDAASARIVVITKPLAEKLFGSTEVVGKTIKIASTPMRIAGVIENWVPAPHFFDLTTGDYNQIEQVFMPFSTSREMKLGRNGSMNCWKETEDSEALNAPCEWIQYWVELGTTEKASAFKDYLVQYSLDQKKAGRFQREPNVRLRTVMEWLEFKEVVPADARLQTWIALGFLLVCLINTVGLLLTKFLRRSSEIGVRRALGASKRSIFFQLLIESGMIGLAGGLLGLGLAWLGLWAVRHQPANYAGLAELDLPMLGATFVLALASSLLAGLLPAWRACQITPAIQLKSH